MSLVPTKTTRDEFTEYSGAYAYCQAVSHFVVECGYYVDPVTGDEILIEKSSTTSNQYGHTIAREVERWEYEVPGAPPLQYVKEVYGRHYLPGIGRGYRLLEREVRKFYPWSGFQPGTANLSSIREVSGWVVYDLHVERAALSAESKAALQEMGLNPDGPATYVVDSARTWREAHDESSITQKPEAPQVSHWVEPYETETELVFEYVDRFDKYTERVIHIRPGPPERSGPEVTRKESYEYRLPVPIDPPTIKAADAGDDGVRLEVEAGGATVNGRRIHPERYKVLRRALNDPTRPASGDPFGVYDDDPAPAAPTTVIRTTDVTNLDGAPASGLPAQQNYTEPGDTTEPPVEGWAVIAEVDNEQTRPAAPGYAVVFDTDVINGGEYEYVGVAVIGDDESQPSAPARITFGGSTHSSRIRVRVAPPGTGGAGGDDLVLDVVAPDDEAFTDYGETVEFEVPAVVDPDEAVELAEEIATRQFVVSREPKATAELELTAAPIYLVRGQCIKTPAVGWRTTGNALQIEAETVEAEWILEGFELRARAGADGELLEVTRSTMTLLEP